MTNGFQKKSKKLGKNINTFVDNATKAPYQDFRFLSKLYEYRTIDHNISRIALHKFRNHLWYLSPEIALAFFYLTLPLEWKQKMIDALNRESCDENIKRILIKDEEISEFMQKGFEYIVSPETKNFFKRFELDDQFLQTDPSTWSENTSFQKGLEVVNKLRVI
ncbi:hypothetical protein ALC60_04185 [Trachymyrmex zeteki]|uniref:Uncharacterized protein n=1 Tax=Mycetomoellerius zeteki TaxID=64791 RepID=A0A151X937_9HYME|nr:hypothetical protein ALC60_04185 [Trachymyrmex zeteki]